MSELPTAGGNPRSPATPPASGSPVSGAAARRRSTARTLARAAVSVLPWFLVGAGCLSEDDTGDPALERNPVGQGSNSAGTGGSSAPGTGGTQNGGMTGVGGSTARGGSSSMAGSGQAPMGSGGNMSILGAAPGETGIFVGMTAAHNAARQSLEVDPPLPDLAWSEELADFAQEWAETLVNDQNCGTIFHRTQNMYGENIAFKGSAPLRLEYAPEEAVESWFSEIDCWEYGTIRGTESCEPVCISELNSTGCGHFTQIAWRNTREVGCGYATCEDGMWTNEVWVCNYSPPGNFVGQAPF